MADPVEDELRDDEEEGGAGWLTTWADMMSVLLTFFIVLQAFSTLNQRKFMEAVQSIQRAFSIPLPVRAPGTAEFRPPDTTAEELEERIAQEEIEGISVQDYGDRMVLTVDSSVLFQVGHAELTPQGAEVIRRVAMALADANGQIRIEGHTCDLKPGPGSRYPDNWWLSTARAVTVLEALQRAGLPPERLAAAGYGEFRPVAPNDGEENRRKNRRVEFVIEKSARLSDGS